MEEIIPVAIEEELQSSFISYAISVITDRALPDVRDGFKPVHRRVIYAMDSVAKTGFKKSAAIVGECFVRGTLISTPAGLIPIEFVSVGDKVYTGAGNIGTVKNLFCMPPRPLLRVCTKRGSGVVATSAQPFRVLDLTSRNLDFLWRKAGQLRPGDWLVTQGPEGVMQEREISLPSYSGQRMYLDSDLAYLLGLLMSDGWVAFEGGRNRLGFCGTMEVMVKIADVLLAKFGYQANIEVKYANHKKYKPLYIVRINSGELNRYFTTTFNLCGISAISKCVPAQVLLAGKSISLAFLSGLIDGDGHISKRRRLIQYVTVSESLTIGVQTILRHFGVSPRHYIQNKKGPGLPSHSLELCGEEAGFLGKALRLFCKEKAALLSTFPSRVNRSCFPSDYDLIPGGSDLVFSELSKFHLGAGWYSDTQGKKFRLGIKHQSGAKIRYSSSLYQQPLHFCQVKAWGLLEKLNRLGSALGNRLADLDKLGLRFDEVISIEPAPKEETYDLEVQGSEHSFIANGLVVHNCIGKYHPHGDKAIYDSMVRMGQPWSLRYPLVVPQGNFGSVDGDPPAAMRYTEARLSRLGIEMLDGIRDGTVDFRPTYDENNEEPVVLPGAFPNLMVNGSEGIAVGMATKIPPHNLREIINLLIALLKDPSLENVTQYVPGPDFPTGAVIVDGEPEKAYGSGRGSFTMRAEIEVEKTGKREALIVTSLPYQVNKAALLEEIAAIVNIREKDTQGHAKRSPLDGIRDIRDESDRTGIRCVFELASDASAEVLKSRLFKLTQLEKTFPANLVVLVDGTPCRVSLKKMAICWLRHFERVTVRKFLSLRQSSEKRLHIVLGFLQALKHVDRVIQIIRSSESDEEAIQRLNTDLSAEKTGSVLGFSTDQARAILAMQLRALTKMSGERLLSERSELESTIKTCTEIIDSPSKRTAWMQTRLEKVSEDYGDDRRTKITYEGSGIDLTMLYEDKDYVVTLTHRGYLRSVAADDYRQQGRGGQGSKGVGLKDGDAVEHIIYTRTFEKLLFFTTSGQVYGLSVFSLPGMNKQAAGRHLNQLLSLKEDEQVASVVKIPDFSVLGSILTATSRGIVKRTAVSDYGYAMTVRGVRGLSKKFLDDQVIGADIVNDQMEILLATAQGRVSRFPASLVRDMGRGAAGVVGMKLKGNDKVISLMAVSDSEDEEVLVVTARGFGKKTTVSDFRCTGRGSQGLVGVKVSTKTGPAAAFLVVADSHDILLLTNNGKAIRVPSDTLRSRGRRGMLVKLASLEEGDAVAAVVAVPEEERILTDG